MVVKEEEEEEEEEEGSPIARAEAKEAAGWTLERQHWFHPGGFGEGTPPSSASDPGEADEERERRRGDRSAAPRSPP